MIIRRRRGLLLAGFLSVLLLMSIATVIVIVVQDGKLSAKKNSESFVHQKVLVKTANEAAIQDAAVTKLFGFSAKRVADDESTIDGLARSAFTWSSGASYDSARLNTEDQYGIPSDSQFLKTIVPYEPYFVDNQGKRYYYLNSVGGRSSLVSVTMNFQGANAGVYSYVAEVTIRVSTGSTNKTKADIVGAYVTSERTVLLTVRFNIADKINSISGYEAGDPTTFSN